MEYLLIPIVSILASAKVIIQSRFAKNMAKTPMDAIFFNGLIFSVGGILLSYRLVGGTVDSAALIAGILVGIGNLVFQMGYVFAFACGPVSLTTLIVTTSMILPILLSAIVYDEPLSGSRILGIGLTFVALYFTSEKTKHNKVRLRWVLFTLMAFVGNSVIGLTQKIYTKSFASGETTSFVAVHLLFAAVISMAIYLIFRGRGKRCSYKVDRSVVCTAAVIGLLLGAFHVIYTYALSVIDATILLPVYNGLITIMVTVGSAIFVKEKLSKRQYLSIALGVIAIVLMSI